MTLKNIALFIAAWTCIGVSGQVPVGHWQDHFPYHEAIDVQDGGDKVFTATQYALFSYDIPTGEIERLSKVNGLSDINITDIDYHDGLNVLVVAYGNGNLDLVKEEETVNLPFIKMNTSIVGDKTIYGVHVNGDFAYLACGFGIVQVDLIREEIAETFIIGPGGSQIKINQIQITPDSIYAAGDDGLFKASMTNPALLNNFNYWTKDNTLPSGVQNGPLHQLSYFNGTLLVGWDSPNYQEDTLYAMEPTGWEPVASIVGKDILGVDVDGNQILVSHNNNCEIYDTAFNSVENYYTYGSTGMSPKHAVLGSGTIIYVADFKKGLAVMYDPFNTELVSPSGPDMTGAFDMDEKDGNLYVVAGGVTGNAWLNMFKRPSISAYIDHEWTRISETTIPELQDDSIFDVMAVAVDPEDPTHVYTGTFSFGGILELNNKDYTGNYDESNSSLQDRGIAWEDWVGCAGLAFDEDGNLWATNAYASEPLSVKTPGGAWQSFSLGSSANNNLVGDLVVDDFGVKWVIVPGVGLVAFDDNGTLFDDTDDQVRMLSTAEGNGNLPSQDVRSLAVDKDGELWVGTTEGVAVIYTPENVFSGGDFDAQQILIEQDGNIQILLETEIISAIEVDGADRKWFGTRNSGVYLMSADGTKEELRFNEDNSPLLSNSINSIEVNDVSGEVFFGTENGIISYRGTATEGDPFFSNVYAFPNPVKPDYFGPITIKGLARDSDVKITDVSGSLIYETTSTGGQAIWNGNNFSGERARTGVYLVFAADKNGEFTKVAKILVVN